MSVEPRSQWKTTLAVVSGGHFLSHFYFLTLPPLFPLLRGEFGLTNTQLGLIVSMLAVGGLLQAPVGGVVDRVGAKWVFVVGLAVTAAGIAGIGLGGSYLALLALALVSGVGQSSFHPADYAVIDATAAPSYVGRAFSIHTFCGFAGFAVAPVVVGSLALAVGWRIALLVVGGVGLAYAGVAALALTTPTRATTGDGADDSEGLGFRRALARPGIVAMVGFFLVLSFAGTGINTFTTVLAVDAYGLTEATANTLLTAYFALGAVGVLVGGFFADRFRPGRVILVALGVAAAVLAVTVQFGPALGPIALAALFGIVGFFATLITPARDRLVSALSAHGTVGQSFGIVFTGGTVGGLVGPVLLGAAGDAESVPVAFALVAAFFAVAGLVAFAIGRRWAVR